VQHAGGERQALFPAARELPGELLRACGEPELLERLLDRLLAIWHFVDARDEVQVLADREVVPEGEALRHVADVALDLRAFLQDVVAEAGAAARIRGEQAAQHADRGGLAAAIGTQEAEDLARLHAQREIDDHVLVAEALVEPVYVDGRCGRVAHCRCTSSGWPGWSFTASSGVGCASIM
jgi:hypothetical protein